MSEKKHKKAEEQNQGLGPETDEPKLGPSIVGRKKYLSRKNLIWVFKVFSIIFVLFAVLIFGIYKLGYSDDYIKHQFIAAFAEMGIEFNAEIFHVGVSPLTLTLKNVTFNNSKTGEKLFKIEHAKLDMTVLNLYELKTERNVDIEATEVNGFEVWINFDETGKSNFNGVEILPPKNIVKFQYASNKLSLNKGMIHFGEVEHKLSGQAKNIVFNLESENKTFSDGEKRYKFDLTSTDSDFAYNENKADPITIRVSGIADDKGADITDLTIISPMATSNLSGKVEDWQTLRYDLKISSRVDLAKSSEVYPIETPIRGIGNFEGVVKGKGANYKIVGEITSRNLTASNIRLRALTVNTNINGKNKNYNGHGKAIAELLTFGDFIISYPQISGNIRGTGTDFKWFGELRAAALRTSLGTVAGLYISDADAEYQDRKLNLNLRDFRAKNFSSGGVEIKSLTLNSARITSRNGVINTKLPNARAKKVNVKGASLRSVNVRDVEVKNRDLQTEVNASDALIDLLETKNAKLKNILAKNLVVRNSDGATYATAASIQSESTQVNSTRVGNINATDVNVKIVGQETKIYSNNIKVAKIASNSATLGSLNIAGVRLTVREGKIEGTSDDFSAGDIGLLGNGDFKNVKVKNPVFILEPAGQYRASLDMSLGGGLIGNIKLGAAKTTVVADNDRIELRNLSANVMGGKLDGNAIIATNEQTLSKFNADFTDLDMSKLLTLQSGEVVPIEGEITGRTDMEFYGADFRRSSGTLTADINTTAGSEDKGLIPLSGKLRMNAINGLFSIDYASLGTQKSNFEASGKFDLHGDQSNLNLTARSTDANEVERIFRALNLSDNINRQLDSYQAEFAGNFESNAQITGNLSDPFIDGKAMLDSFILRGKDMGSLVSGLYISPGEIKFREGVLKAPDNGKLSFNVTVPRIGTDNIAVRANLENVDLGSLMAALAIKSLPDSLRDLNAETSGKIDMQGLPNDVRGEANFTAKNGLVTGESFDLQSKIFFKNTLITIEKFEATLGSGFLSAKGTYETDSTAFDFNADGSKIPISMILVFFPEKSSFPDIDGLIDLKAQFTGHFSDSASYNLNFSGIGQNVVINQNAFSIVNFKGKTENQMLNANLTTNFRGQEQIISANVNFADPNVPFKAQTKFNKTHLDPYIAVVRKPEPSSIELAGVATGGVFLEGSLTKLDSSGNRVFTTEYLQGNAQFSQFDLQIGDIPLNATKPIDVKFNMSEISVAGAKFSGGGSNLYVLGTIALNDNGVNNLELDGKINLKILNVLSENIFFSGFADLGVRLTGANRNSRLNGEAQIENASTSTFIGTERITFERLKGSVIFTTDQIQIQSLTGFLGGGMISATGGASLKNLELNSYRIELTGNNITAQLPKDFVTTGNADIQINARRIKGKLDTFISGEFYAKRSVYSKDIDLADIVSRRREASLSQGTSGSSVIGVPKLDIRVFGRNALHIHNNLADLNASADLRVTGDIEFPQIFGHISANSGTIIFRDDRYDVQRGILTFPPNTSAIEPIINLQAESQINGYQIFVNLSGKLTDTESFNATLRSTPLLPQADVVSLITTGSLSNTGTGIPTYAQSGLNTAAEILADEIVNKPVTRATDKLFGLNKFALDPIVSGIQRNPTARLTVGRQINRNLLVTYSTNLSEDQNQVLALEYRISNKLSFAAQYEQRSLTNVTNDRNSFRFEVRLRKRF